MKIRNKRRLFTFTLAFLVLCSVFVVTAFAWTSSPVGAEYYIYLESPDFPGECAAVAWYSPGENNSPELLQFALDFSIVLSVEDVEKLLVFYDSTSLLTNGGAVSNYNSQVISPLVSLYKNNNLYTQGFFDGINNIGESADETIKNAYNQGFLNGERTGYLDGFYEGESKGYTEGVGEGEVASNFLLTLFSAPTYILSTIFNFEIFGINIYLLITFLLTIVIVGFVLKKIL